MKDAIEGFARSASDAFADLVVDGVLESGIDLYYHGKFSRSLLIDDAYEAEDFFPNMGEKGRWLYFTAAPLRNALGEVIGAIETLQDISERKSAETELLRMHADLEAKVARRTEQLQRAKASLPADEYPQASKASRLKTLLFPDGLRFLTWRYAEQLSAMDTLLLRIEHGLPYEDIAEVMDWLQSDGPRAVWIGVWSENFGAQRFYERHGFEKVGEYYFPVGETRDLEFILRRG